jgi:hypothetical protein
VTSWLEFWERIVEPAGNREIWGMARTTMIGLLPHWAGRPVCSEIRTLLQQLADLPYADRVSVVPRWFDRLIDCALVDLDRDPDAAGVAVP